MNRLISDQLFGAQLKIPRLPLEAPSPDAAQGLASDDVQAADVTESPAEAEDVATHQVEEGLTVAETEKLDSDSREDEEEEPELSEEETDEIPLEEEEEEMVETEPPAKKRVKKAKAVDDVTSPTLRKMRRGARSQKSSHTYSAMVKEAIESLTAGTRKGASCPAIKKFLQDKFNLTIRQSRTNTLINKALKEGLESGLLVKAKGRGLSGSFKVGADRKEKDRVQKIAKEKREKEKEREKRFIEREEKRLRHMEESTRLKHVMKVRIARRKQHQRLLEKGVSPLETDLVDRVQSILEQN